MSTGSSETDRKILVKFYRSAIGRNWHCRVGWDNNNLDLGSWFGVKTNNEGRVVELHIHRNNLQGAIPSELGELSALKPLQLKENQLSGAIPSEFSGLSALETLDLYSNKLSGAIPSELGGLSALETLDLYSNKLSGVIPSELGGLSALKTLNLAANELSGAIPSELGGLSALKTLELYSNKLTGAIPSEFGGLSALKTLNLYFNKLSGMIPSELGGLSALKTLQLFHNQLSGAIPSEFGGLSALETLGLNFNKLSGAIPSEFGGLRELKTLNLRSNKLSGVIPSELGGLSALRALDLGSNKLSDLGDVQHALKLVSQFDFDGDFFDREKRLDLRNNPWKMPPEAVVEQGLEAIKIYLGDVQKASENGAQVRSLKLLKVVLVGAASAGKTSLMRTIIKGASSPTEGPLYETSTVGIELRPHRLQGGTKIEFYDCAGQVDYAGMHQTFLTRRALYLLVWDVKLFRDLDDRSLEKAVYMNIMRWLYTLHLRAPGSTVILVANKCDTTPLSNFEETTKKVEKLATHLLKEWQNRRKGGDVTVVRLLDGVSRTSCTNYGGIDDLVGRISEEGSTSIKVPPAWDLALKVLDALRAGDDPLRAAREHLELKETTAELGETIQIETKTFTTKSELLMLWQNIVLRVSRELESNAKDMAATVNWESAFNGALWISEFAGQILPIDDDRIFLDVVWLSKVLSPILNHKLHGEDFPTTSLIKQRDSLVNRGILRWDFALHLWADVLDSVEQGLRGKLIESLFRALLNLGVIIPLGRPAFLSDRRRSHTSRSGRGFKDMLVIMRLPEECSRKQQSAIESAIAKALHDGVEVELKWEFDAARAPYGLVERLISSCHILGNVELGACWRYGALFTSRQTMRRHGKEIPLYKFLIHYHERMLSLRMIGPLSNDRVLAALRYVASAMVILSMGWPGVQWMGWLHCPNHPDARMYLTKPREARIGGRLVHKIFREDRDGMNCDCQLEPNGMLQLVNQRLGTVLDTRKGHPVEGFEKEPIPPGRRPRAWQTARALGTLGVLFCSVIIVGIAEEKDILWMTSVPILVLLLVAAFVVSVHA